MNYLDLTILEIHHALLEGKVTPLELLQESLKRAKEDNNNAFEYISEQEAYEALKELDNKDKNNIMWGIPFAIKDNFSTKDIPTTASSNILNGYKPIFSSEVYQRLLNAGGIPIGKTTLDELGMGGQGVSGHRGPTFNPYDPTHKHMVGGSSCGSASVVASNIVPIAIGSDTGDSVRKPASYAGLVGFKPTWGRISRFGLFPFAPSLDHVAYFTRSVEDSAAILTILSGYDEKDMTSSKKPVIDYKNNLKLHNSPQKVAVIKEIYESIIDQEILKTFDQIIKSLEEEGIKVNYASLDEKLCRAIYPTYIVISSAEATSNNAKLDGIKYGPSCDEKSYEKIVMENRTKGFSELIKRRFIIGSYSLLSENQNEIFIRAQKCRRLIVDAINDILKDNDFIILPAAPSTAPLFKKDTSAVTDKFILADNYLCFANFAGLPSLTIPMGRTNNLPFGINITGRAFEEDKVLSISLDIENITGLKNLSAREK